MGGFCGVVSKNDCMMDLFFGTDYHSHLGTHRGGIAVLNNGTFERSIHNIQNSPFRSKFERDVTRMSGRIGVGVISDTDPQPLVMTSHLGMFAIVTVGMIANIDKLMAELFESRKLQLQFSTTSGMVGPTELVSAMIASEDSFTAGIQAVREKIEGSCSILLVTSDGKFYAARDKYGRTPVIIGRKADSMIVVQESCALTNLGYDYVRDLGPGEVVELGPDWVQTLVPPGDKMAICSFLWVYYGYPASSYEGRNVELARYRSGCLLARRNPIDADGVAGVPDSGTSHALGYAHESGLKYLRPFVKYTPTWARSFMPSDQRQRDRVASMKLIPIPELIKDKRLVMCDDSIVRGTQLGHQAKRLFADGATAAHMRISCPPLLYGCKFLNFSRSKSIYDLITRRYIRVQEGESPSDEVVAKYRDPDTPQYKAMVEYIRAQLGLTSLAFQRLDDLVDAIGLPREKICTYCWTGEDVSCSDCAHNCASCTHSANT